MIPVSNSRIIEFIDWIKAKNFQKHFSVDDFNSLHQLATVFLQENIFISPKRSEGLKLVVELYQSSPLRIYEPIERMRQFCYSYTHEYAEERIILTRVPLEKFLKKFITYTNAIDYKSWFDAEFYNFFEKQGKITPCSMSLFIEMFGASLERIFALYCSQLDSNVIIKFRNFLREKSTYSIEPLRDKEFEAEGLAVAVRELINGEFYDDVLAKNKEQSEFLCLISNLPVDLVQGLTFVEWVREKESAVNLLGNIPSKKIEHWSRDFCKAKGYTNVNEFTRSIKSLLSSNNSISQISERIKRYIRNRSPYLEARNDLFSRYDTVIMHGMFIFAPNHNLKGFIESNWKQFNYILGESIDVYYSIEDLEGRINHSIDQYEYLNIDLKDLPAFVFWNEKIKEREIISFNGLDKHEDIAEMFEEIIVVGIRNKDSGESIINNSLEWKTLRMKERKLEKRTGERIMNIYNGQNFVNNGNNNSMEIKDNYIQHTVEMIGFKDEDINSLKILVEALKDNKDKDLPEDLALEGAAILSGLIRASKEKNEASQKNKLIEFKSWKERIGEKGIKVLSIIADITTLTIPIIQLISGF